MLFRSMGDGILFLALQNLVISVARLIIFSNQFLDTEEISGNTIKILFKEKSSNVLLLHKKSIFQGMPNSLHLGLHFEVKLTISA